MKKGTKLILFVAVLAVLVGAWMLVNRIDVDGTAETTETTYLYPVNTDSTKITAITYSVGAETYSFVLSDGTWKNPNDGDMPIDQSRLGEIASALSTVACTRLVTTDGAGSAEYGLDDPGYRVTLTYSDNSTVCYIIGDKNIHKSEYYFAVEGESAVYLVNSALLGYCDNTYEEVLALDEIKTIDADAVTSVVVSHANGTATLTPQTRLVTETDDDGNETEGEEKYYILKNEAENEAELTEADGDAILSNLLSPVVLSCADYRLTEEEYAAYGFDSPYTVTIHYTTTLTVSTDSSSSSTVENPESYTLTVGFVGEGEERSAYMRYEGSVMLFAVNLDASAALY